MSDTLITIDAEVWGFRVEYNSTKVYDADGEFAFSLRFTANEKEVIAAIYGYGAGKSIGEKIGMERKSLQIRQALGITAP